MFGTRRSRLASALFLVLALAGCDDQQEILGASQGASVEEEVAEVLRGVVLPTVEKLASFSPINQPGPPRDDARSGEPEECASFDRLCGSGSFEVCSAAPTGAVTYRYRRCSRPSGLLDGAWSLEQDGFQASAELDLSLGDLVLAGSVDYVLDDMCWLASFVSLRASRPGRTTTIAGFVSYCFPAGAVAGDLQVSATGPSGPVELSLEFDSGEGSAMVVLDAAAVACRFDTRGGETSCDVD